MVLRPLGQPSLSEDPDTKEDPIPKEVVRVIVEVAGNINETDRKKISNDPGRILLKFPEDATAGVIGDVNDTFEVGLKRLSKLLNDRGSRDSTKLQIEVHPALRYQYFIQVQDVCRAAKFKEMGFPKPVRPKKAGN